MKLSFIILIRSIVHLIRNGYAIGSTFLLILVSEIFLGINDKTFWIKLIQGNAIIPQIRFSQACCYAIFRSYEVIVAEMIYNLIVLQTLSICISHFKSIFKMKYWTIILSIFMPSSFF